MKTPEFLQAHLPLIDLIEEPLISYDRKGNITWASSCCLGTLGYSADEISGMNIDKLIWMAAGDKRSRLDKFLAPGSVEGFKLLLKKDVGLDVVGEKISFDKANLHSVEAMARVIQVPPDHYLAVIRNIQLVRMSNFYHFSSELFLVLDQKDRIVDYNDHFYDKFYIPMGRIRTYHHKHIYEFIDEANWRHYMKLREDARRTVESACAGATGEWSLDHHDLFNGMSSGS